LDFGSEGWLFESKSCHKIYLGEIILRNDICDEHSIFKNSSLIYKNTEISTWPGQHKAPAYIPGLALLLTRSILSIFPSSLLPPYGVLKSQVVLGGRMETVGKMGWVRDIL
jgi:hypothetical protein